MEARLQVMAQLLMQQQQQQALVQMRARHRAEMPLLRDDATSE